MRMKQAMRTVHIRRRPSEYRSVIICDIRSVRQLGKELI